MRVEWEIDPDDISLDARVSGVDGCISLYQDEGTWVALRLDCPTETNSPPKTSDSLPELMAWAEEELKFKWSHSNA